MVKTSGAAYHQNNNEWLSLVNDSVWVLRDQRIDVYTASTGPLDQDRLDPAH